MLEDLEIESYVKFPAFHAEEKKSYSDKIFLKENFQYDKLADTYRCPNDKVLVFQRTYKSSAKVNGYMSSLKEYGGINCAGCRFYEECCKSKKGGNRTIVVNEKLENYKQKAREKLKSETGLRLRRQRSIEIESCFGDIKYNMEFRRFHLRGLKKVKTEFTLVAIAHNLKKVYLKELQKAA